MAHLSTWLRVLIVVVLLGNLVDFILPKGDLKRYGGLVVGLVLLAAVVSPLWTWMHHVGQSTSPYFANWTNTASGFNQQVQSEELHQAEAIILNMPGVVRCRLSPSQEGGSIHAAITAHQSIPWARLLHYIRSALKVTLGKSPPLVLTVDRVSG